ncbi:AGAP012504-PA, partial [Anopheles gambiae str. PEST]
ISDCEERFYKKIDPIKVAPAAGSPAYLREFAHIAAIGWTNEDQSVRWLCGGSLIWENFILTAAHCAADDDNVPPDVARMGDINIYSDEDDEFAQQLKIVEIIRHPKHKYNSNYYDIALMKLERNVTLHDTVAPSCLWLDDEIRFPELLAAGWGRTGFDQNTTKTLLKVQLAPITNDKCSTHYQRGVRKLENGLMDHQFCAGDEKMDTCPGDSGGPLHVKLFKEWKLIPFLVGVTSFGKACGLAAPGVYVKVSKFGDWIIETLQRHGEMATRFKFEPLVCTDRYYNLREYKEDLVRVYEGREYLGLSNAYVSSTISNNVIEIGWQDDRNTTYGCYGYLISTRGVVSSASCLSERADLPNIVRIGGIDSLDNSRVVPVEKVIIHPDYNKETLEHNIAIVKLESTVDPSEHVFPTCLWQNITHSPVKQLVLDFGTMKFSQINEPLHSHRTLELSSLKYSDLLPQGLQNEHLCFQNQPFLVPGSCNALPGSAIEQKYSVKNVYIHGINLFGRDCGYGESAVGIRLSAHKAWLESVLLPHLKSESLVYIDPDLEVGDECEYADGTKGICVAKQSCQAIHTRLQYKQQISFCSNGTVVYCKVRFYKQAVASGAFPSGGSPAYLREFAHIAAIGWTNEDQSVRWLCGGSLIWENFILTAAHCAADDKMPNIARIGGIDSLDNSRVVIIDKVTIHPKYNPTKQQHNIAMIKLESAVEPTESVFPTCLWQNVTHSPINQSVLDLEYNNGEIMTRVWERSSQKCRLAQKYSGLLPQGLKNEHLCFQNQPFLVPGSCNALPGSAIEQEYGDEKIYIHGINLFGRDCGYGEPAVGIRLSAHKAWLESVLLP